MQLDFGFVSICLSEKDCSPAGNVTVKQVETLDPPSNAGARILRIAQEKPENTLRIMWFLDAHGLRGLPHLRQPGPAGHPSRHRRLGLVGRGRSLGTGAKIGEAAARQGYRLSSHLPELCGFTAERLLLDQRYLEYHRRLFELLDSTRRKDRHALGGAGGGKAQALQRPRSAIVALSSWARERLVLENDDRVFTAEDVVQLAEETGVPVVFDWHHHWVNRDGRCGGLPPSALSPGRPPLAGPPTQSAPFQS